MTKKGWKVCSKMLDGSYHSTIQHPKLGGVVYREKEKTFPIHGCGPLTVFSTRKGARSFKRRLISGLSLHIFKVFYEPSSEGKVWGLRGEEKEVGWLVELNDGLLIPGTVQLATWVRLEEKTK